MPYCKLYDEGFKRIGCVLCPMSSNQKIEAVRWPKLVDAYRRAARKYFDRMVERKKSKGIIVTWKNADEWIDWWMDRNRKKKNPDQTVIFE
ncbi:MAG: phosphoadenosine phosphosulfate reductase [Firmicutes bacterium]|nr:phosphoadenosine phosphosulfate reductase [Bacillota bacterium]